MYNYQEERRYVFSEEGQRMFLAIRDNIKTLIEQAGVVRMDRAIGCVTGSTWQMMACVDRLVELEELREIPQENPPGQYRIFVARK